VVVFQKLIRETINKPVSRRLLMRLLFCNIKTINFEFINKKSKSVKDYDSENKIISTDQLKMQELR
jgi:hypothetical protein